MLNYLTLKPKIFGLDISDLSLKIIQLKERGKFFDLSSFGETRMKPGAVEQGEVKDEEALARNIKTAVATVSGEKLKTKYVAVSLPEEKAFLQVIQMPYMKEEEVEKAVYFEAENYIPLPMEKVYLDSQIISKDPKSGRLNVLIAALPRTTIDPYMNALKKAGLKPVILEIESLAISRVLVKEKTTPKPLLLIDLGENRTSFSIFFDQSLRFTTTCSVSSKRFSEMIAENLGIDFKKAEALKIKNGIAVGQQGRKIFQAVEPSLKELVELTKKYLDYCQKEYNQKIDKILLCGGGVSLQGFVEFFSDKLNVKVELANPWVNILPNQEDIIDPALYRESLRYTTALGLALKGIKHD